MVIRPGAYLSDEAGRFSIRHLDASPRSITFSAVGYAPVTLPLSIYQQGQQVIISPRSTQLTDVVITANTTNPYKANSQTDIKLYVMEMLTTLFRAKLTTGLADFWVAANAIKACTKIVI